MTQIKKDWFFKKALEVSEEMKREIIRTDIRITGQSDDWISMSLSFFNISYIRSFPLSYFHDAVNVQDFFHEEWAKLFSILKDDLK